MTKLTKKDALNFVLTNCELPEEIADKLTAMVEQLNKKATGERKPTKKQLESAERGAKVAEFIENADEPMTATAIAKAIFGEDATASKVTAHLTKLVKDGKVVRSEEKRVAYFAKAE